MLNWTFWWVPQLLIVTLFVMVLGPLIGKRLLSILDQDLADDRDLHFIFGFAGLFLLSSFLVPFGRGGLVILFLLMMFLKPNLKEVFLGFGLLDILLFVAFSGLSFLAPYGYDTNPSALQLHFFSDWWPLDTLVRQDTQYGFSLLMESYWPGVPAVNILSTQSGVFAVFAWKVVKKSFEVMCEKKHAVDLEKFLLFLLFITTLFFRKQIHLKASPLGGLFLILAFSGIAGLRRWNPATLGFLFVCTLSFGEYGGVIVLFSLPFLMMSLPMDRFWNAVGWGLIFSVPEVFRKLWEFQVHNPFILIGVVMASVILGFLFIQVRGRLLSEGKPNVSMRISFSILLVASITISFLFPLYLMPAETTSFSWWTWFVTKEGMVGVTCLLTLLLFRAPELDGLRILAATQFLIFALWRVLASSNVFDVGSDLYFLAWNIFKNSNMITLPLVTTLVVAYTVFVVVGHNPVLVGILSVFLLFFQDPLVSSVGHGPFAPHAPRYSVLRTFTNLYDYVSPQLESSSSGNIVLPPVALREGDLIEKIYAEQSLQSEPLKICLGGVDLGANSWELGVYTFVHPTGANIVPQGPECRILIIRESPPVENQLLFQGKMYSAYKVL